MIQKALYDTINAWRIVTDWNQSMISEPFFKETQWFCTPLEEVRPFSIKKKT